MSILDRIIGWSIHIYRRTPLHPQCGAFLARMLLRLQRLIGASGIVTRHMEGVRIKLDLAYSVDSQLYYSGAFEPRTVATLRHLVRPGDTVFDVGANIGYLTLVLRQCVGEQGEVVCFEPIPEICDRLRENVAMNHFTNVIVVQAGVGGSPGRATLRLHPATRLDGRPGTAHDVPILTLDDYVREHAIARLDLVKIDIDGGEADVLRGGIETLRRFRPIVLIEVGADAIDQAKAVIQRLGDLRYRFFDDARPDPLDDPLCVIGALAAGTTMNLLAKADVES